MSNQAKPVQLLKVINQIIAKENITNTAYFNILAQTAYQAIHRKSESELSDSTLENLLLWSWECLQVRKQAFNLHFYDHASENKKNTTRKSLPISRIQKK